MSALRRLRKPQSCLVTVSGQTQGKVQILALLELKQVPSPQGGRANPGRAYFAVLTNTRWLSNREIRQWPSAQRRQSMLTSAKENGSAMSAPRPFTTAEK